MASGAVITELEAEFGDLFVSEFRGQVRATVGRTQVIAVLQTLKEQHGFDQLVDVTVSTT